MTYIIEGFRSEGRVRIGRVGMRNLNPRVLAGLGAALVTPSVPGGTGTANDPFGGIGGGTEAQLKALVQAGITFTSPHAETGLVNGEKYVYSGASNKKFYKFKVPGSGLGKTPSDAAALKWFNDVIVAATPKKAVVDPPVTPGGIPIVLTPPMLDPNRPKLSPNFPTSGSGAGDDGKSGNTMIIVGGIAAVGVALLFLKKRGKAAS